MNSLETLSSLVAEKEGKGGHDQSRREPSAEQIEAGMGPQRPLVDFSAAAGLAGTMMD